MRALVATHEEIRNRVLNILLLFPTPLPIRPHALFAPLELPQLENLEDLHIGIDTSEHEQQGCGLLQYALTMCLGARAGEAESGAALCTLVFHKFIVHLGETYAVKVSAPVASGPIQLHVTAKPRNSAAVLEEVASLSGGLTSKHALIYATLNFAAFLLDCLQGLFALMKKDVVRAAKYASPNGILAALTTVLRTNRLDVTNSSPGLSARISICLREIVLLSKEMSAYCLNLLTNSDNGAAAMPSFAEMQAAVDFAVKASTLSTTSGSEIPAPGDLSAVVWTSSHQYVQSLAWLTVKSCSAVLAAVVCASQLSDNPVDATADVATGLTATDVESIGESFTHILLRCRHRGVLEKVSDALTEISRYIFSNTASRQCQALPLKWLDACVASFTQRQFASVSVTRRGAGIPYIIQSILTSQSQQVMNLP